MANAHFVILERWFGKDWREVYLILHEDSTLMWYSERGDSSPEGGVFLKDSPEMIAAGQVSTYLKIKKSRILFFLTSVLPKNQQKYCPNFWPCL